MKIEAGKYYKNKAGEVLGPMEINDDDVYPFICQADDRYRSYMVDGTFYVNHRGDDDIIEECNADGSPIEPMENHLGTASCETTFDKQRRQEIAQAILCAMIASAPVCNRADVDKAKWCGIAFEWADQVIKVAKQS